MLSIVIFLIQLFIHRTVQQNSQVIFRQSSLGMEFQCSNCTDPSLSPCDTTSRIQCATLCFMNDRCQTFQYDSASSQCRLFTAWVHQGTIAPSTSTTSKVIFVQQTPALYSLYQQPCDASRDSSRYLICTNTSLWSCPPGQFYNGSICQQQCMGSGTNCSLSTVPSYRWNTSGITIAGVTGVSGAAPNLLKMPNGVSVDTSSAVYVSDQQNSRIQKWIVNATNGTTVAGQANGTTGSSADTLMTPNSAIVDAKGNVYIVDTFNSRVQLWRNGSSFGTTIAGTGYSGPANNQLSAPRDIALDPISGAIYISDSWNHRVMRYLVNASSGVVVAGGNGRGTNNTQLNYPYGFYLDTTTNSLIIVNSNSNNVVRWVLGSSSWTLIAGSSSGASGSSSNLLNGPLDVTMDPMGNVYVADTDNQRIQFFPAGSLNGSTIAGVTGISGASSTRLYNPNSLALDSQLNLYVADTFNQRIQKFLRL